MTTLTLEQQKHRYSRELADYTMRQWRSAVRSQSKAENAAYQAAKTSRRRSPSDESSSSMEGVTEGLADMSLSGRSKHSKSLRKSSKSVSRSAAIN